MPRKSLDFSSVTISYLIHSTEDEVRFNEEVRRAFLLEPQELVVTETFGHYGNLLSLAKAHLTGKRANATVARIAARLSPESKELIRSSLENSMDEHDALYLRLDRQQLTGNSFFLSDQEPIRVKLKPKIREGGREAMQKAYAQELQLV